MEEKNEEMNKEFNEADKRFDKIISDAKSNVTYKKKIFLKISDVDIVDADRLKRWCDRHVDGKQFLGIKALMDMAERVDFMAELIRDQMKYHDLRITALEDKMIEDSIQPSRPIIPKTQGAKR